MNCRDFRDLLQERLDGTALDTPPACDEHLRTCPACAALHAAAVRLGEGLRLLAAPTPPPDLADRIADRVLRKRLWRRPRGRRRVAVPLVLAACLLVAIAARLSWHRNPTSPTAPTPHAGAQQPQPPGEPVDLRESVDEAKQAVVALTARTADEAVDRTRRLLAPGGSPSVSPPPARPPAQALREAGEGVSDGLEPVTHSARRAVDLFLRELPPMDFGEKQGL
jgi:predicted anti-sigma-YlaC factor YlaD